MSNDLVISLVPGPVAGPNTELHDWLREHDIDPNDCRRLEVFRDDCIAYLFKRNEKGNKYLINKEKKVIAEEEPITFKRKRPIPDVG